MTDLWRANDLPPVLSGSTRRPPEETMSNVRQDPRGIGSTTSEEGPTLEVRWVCPGALATSMIDWFTPFLEHVESREDAYLVGQQIQGISVKFRGGARLDIKVASGSHGVLDLPGRARGHLQSWKKWSFPIALVPEMGAASADWVRVGKIRRIGRFSFADGAQVTRGVSSGEDLTTCAVELTEVLKSGERWWTLGFEAVGGHPGTMREAIETTAAMVFNDPLPGDLELNLADSTSYVEWLHLSDPQLTPTLF
jgi:hypothetical protein